MAIRKLKYLHKTHILPKADSASGIFSQDISSCWSPRVRMARSAASRRGLARPRHARGPRESRPNPELVRMRGGGGRRGESAVRAATGALLSSQTG